MDAQRSSAGAGIATSVATVLAVLLPHLMPSIDGTSARAYYDYGLLGGWSVLAVALVAVVVFASVFQRRSDPAVAAGAGLVLGVVASLLAAFWAFSVPYEVVVQLHTNSLFAYHRWLLLLASIGIAVSGGWIASTRDLF